MALLDTIFMDFGGPVGSKNPTKLIIHLASRKSLKCVRRYHGSTVFKVPGLQKILENSFKNPFENDDHVGQHVQEPKNSEKSDLEGI